MRHLHRMLAVTLLVAAPAAAAQEPVAAPQLFAGFDRQTVLYFLFGGGGPIGVACTVPILAMSVAALALCVEHLLTIRRSALIPPGLAEEVHGLITNGSFAHAEQQCRLRPSFLSHVTADGPAILQSFNFNSVRTIGASFDVDF